MPLYIKHDDKHIRVGWVWNQMAYLVNNLHHGWIAFAEDQTSENIDIWKCNCCGAAIGLAQKRKIEEFLNEVNYRHN